MSLFARSIRCLTAGAAALTASVVLACSSPTPPQPPPQTPTLTSVSVTPASVQGGTAAQGTVTLSAAPSSAASVALSSNNAAAAVPGSATVNAGATTGTFSIATAAVTTATPVSISGTFSGVTQSVTLTVTPRALAASFVVRASSAVQRKLATDSAPVTILPAGTLDACPLVNANFDCVFDATASTAPAPIQQYIWAYFVGPRARGPDPTDPRTTSTTPVFRPDESSCNFFGGLQTTSSGGLQFISMRVDLQVRDATGALSSVVSSQNIRIFPAGQCGYGF
jgi:hypothetical protein